MMEAKDTVKLEAESTPIGKFQKERTDAISEMFDNPDECGIYPTTKFFSRLDACVRELLEISFKAGQEERARELYEDVVCPMCYRLNPQHATADYGVGCKSCQEKEDYCGKPN